MGIVENGEIEYYIAEKALELINGDGAFVDIDEKQLFLGIVDGAGHGPEAHTIAQVSCDFLEKNKNMDLPRLMSELHEDLRGTRGGVAIIGILDFESLQFRYVGIGNVVLRKIGRSSKRAVTQDGVIGYNIRTPQEKVMQMESGDILIMHTDGIMSHFDESDYPEILSDNAKIIAKNLICQFGKNDDDATCIVMRFK